MRVRDGHCLFGQRRTAGRYLHDFDKVYFTRKGHGAVAHGKHTVVYSLRFHQNVCHLQNTRDVFMFRRPERITQSEKDDSLPLRYQHKRQTRVNAIGEFSEAFPVPDDQRYVCN